MDRKAFYASLRKRDSGVFGTSMTQRQVDGCEALLTAARGLPVEHAAHVLAEVYHETGRGMYPVAENLNYSAKRIGQVFGKHRLQGKVPAQLAGNHQLLANTVYGGAWGRENLGNTEPGDGWRFRGMGMIQCTGRENARKASALTGFDLVAHPELMLDPQVSAEIAVEGCRAGMFRRHKLADFDRVHDYDHAGARAIVNADVARNGPLVAGYAAAFETALREAGWGVLPPVRPDAAIPPAAARPNGLIAAIAKFLTELFTKGTSK